MLNMTAALGGAQRRLLIRSLDRLGQAGMRRPSACAAPQRDSGGASAALKRKGVISRAMSSASAERPQGAMSPWLSDAPVKGPHTLKKSEEVRLEEHYAFRQAAVAAGQRVDLAGAAIVERIPLIMPDLQDWEVDFYEMQQDVLLRERKYYDPEMFTLTEKQKILRRDQLWAFDVIDMGSKGRIGPLAWNTKIQKEVARLKELSPDDEKKLLEKAEEKDKLIEDARKAALAASSARDDEEAQAGGEEDVDGFLDGEVGLVNLSKEQREDLERFEEIEAMEAKLGDGDEDEMIDLGEVLDDDQMDETTWNLQMDDTESEEVVATDFKPQPRISDADKANDQRSLRRRLQRRLYLIVQVPEDPTDKSGTGPVWRFPAANRQSSTEVVMDAAQRSVIGPLGEIDVYFHGRCPAGYTFGEYNDSAKQDRGSFGVHTMFYRAERLRGNVEVNSEGILDYAWICNDELENYVPNFEQDAYWGYAHQFMDD